MVGRILLWLWFFLTLTTFQIKLSEFLWLQICSVGEIKTTAAESDKAATLLQLCCYMRQMFREQLDRHFALGFTLCLDELSVFLCDRSGVLGTKQSINIHKVGIIFAVCPVLVDLNHL
jgi:hypothetical protein